MSADEPAAAETAVQARPESKYSRTRVNAAGTTLIDPATSLNDLRRARAIVNN